jgi:CPA2 family monovalent cation:H+ antiporter-2
MEHASNLTGLAVVILTALACGMAMARFHQPALVGYLFAGVLLGPDGLHLVANRGLVSALAELGVLLLLFVIGMELSVRTLRFVWRIAVPAVALQIAGSLAVVFLIGWALGYSTAATLVLGFVIALSSTAVAVKMMEETGALRSRTGRVTIAVLIAQDLAFLPMLMVVERAGGGDFGFGALFQIALAIGLLVALVTVLIKRRRIELPFARIIVGHADLSPLSGLVYCFGAGAAFGLLGMSPAYGAFLAGLAIGNSAQREAMLAVIQPIESVLVMVFFLSIGLLIDLGFVWQHIGTVLLLLVLVTLFKTALNVAVLRFLNETWPRAFLGGLLTSQIGEFSFLLAAAGLSVTAIDSSESKLIISVTVLSLALSPFWLAASRRFQRIALNRIPTLRIAIDLTYGVEAAWIIRASARGAAQARVLAADARRSFAWLWRAGPSFARSGTRFRLRRPADPSPIAVPAGAAVPTADAATTTKATLAEIGEQVRRAANDDGAPPDAMRQSLDGGHA